MIASALVTNREESTLGATSVVACTTEVCVILIGLMTVTPPEFAVELGSFISTNKGSGLGLVVTVIK